MSKIRLLAVSPHFFPYNRFEQELLRNLVAKHKEIEVTVLCYKTPKSEVYKSFFGVKIYQVPCYTILPGQFVLPNYLDLIKTLNQIKRDLGVDVLYTGMTFFDSAWWLPVLGKIWAVPTIFTNHSAYHPWHNSAVIRWVAKLVDLMVVRFVLPKYSVVTATSTSGQEFLAKTGYATSGLLHPGVDLGFFTPNKRSQSDRFLPNIEYKFSQSDVVICSAGRFIPAKGFGDLYEAVRPVLREKSGVYLALAGDGQDRERLEKQVANDKLSDKVFFPGFLTKDQIAVFLANADIFVLSSRKQEGFPNLILEAAASGCTVVTTQIGGVVDIIVDGKTGRFLDKDDPKSWTKKIAQLVEDKKLRNELKSALLERTKSEFGWESTTTKFFEILRTVSRRRE